MSAIQEPWVWEPPCPSRFEHAKEQWLKDKIEEICSQIIIHGEDADKDVYDLLWIHIEDNIEKYTEEPSYE